MSISTYKKLIGKYPDEKEKYYQKSPINFKEKLSCPIILFQGEEDKVVPKEQAYSMYEVLKEKKIPVVFMLFENEQHGFRRAENIKRCLESELYFYSKIFNFPIVDNIEEIKIDNFSD